MTYKLNDAQSALGFVISQTSHIETIVNKDRYAAIQYPRLLPVDNSAPDFAKTVTYFGGGHVGEAGWINGNGDDVPLVDFNLSKNEVSVYTAGVGYGYGYEEVQQGIMLQNSNPSLQVALPAEKAIAARRAYEEMVDGIALRGDATKGFSGLINHPSVTATAATTGTWGTATAEQIIADINVGINGVSTDTKYTALANTVLLPMEAINLLASTTMPNTVVTVAEFIKRNNAYTAQSGLPLELIGVRGLETAGAGGVRRMVAYNLDPMTLKLRIPMMHRFFPVYQKGVFNFVVPGMFRLAGLDIMRPKEVRYVDGI